MSVHPNSLKNLTSGGFADHPENINKEGRPPKLTTDVLAKLDDNGIQGVAASEVRKIIEVLLNCTKSRLESYATASGQPFLVNIISQHLLDSKSSSSILDSLLDRAHGKSVQRQQITVGAKPPESLEQLYEAETDNEADEG